MNDKFYEDKLSAEDRIIKAKIALQRLNPFYSYLCMHMKFQRNDRAHTIGVDPDGNVFWNKGFIDKLNDSELMCVISHEATHVVLRHCERAKAREKTTWNIAVDACVNSLLIQNGMTSLPKGGIIPKYDEFHRNGISIGGISKKTAEEIYAELDKAKEEQSKQKAKGKKKDDEDDSDEDGEGDGESEYEFDEHMPEVQKENKDAKDMKQKSQGESEGSGEGGDSDSENKPEEISKTEDLDEKWGRILSEATTHAKLAGKDTNGMDRYVDKLLNPKRNWKNILYREVTNEMAVDTTWNRPSRRSESIGIYLPSQKKENINMAVAIDSSGSVTDEELKSFLSHTRDVIASFANINLTVVVCDSQVKKVHEFNHANINDVKKIEVKGGGGTSFTPVFDYLAKNKPDIKLVIYLTDGDCFEKFKIEKYRGRVLWVLTKRGTEKYIKNTGRIIKMDE
jgi:predicted metal-dependent peptidase